MKFRIVGLYIGFTISVIASLSLAYNLNFEPLLSIIMASSITYSSIYISWHIGKYADEMVEEQGKDTEYDS